MLSFVNFLYFFPGHHSITRVVFCLLLVLPFPGGKQGVWVWLFWGPLLMGCGVSSFCSPKVVGNGKPCDFWRCIPLLKFDRLLGWIVLRFLEGPPTLDICRLVGASPAKPVAFKNKRPHRTLSCAYVWKFEKKEILEMACWVRDLNPGPFAHGECGLPFSSSITSGVMFKFSPTMSHGEPIAKDHSSVGQATKFAGTNISWVEKKCTQWP